MQNIDLKDVRPYIRYVNNYKPACSYIEQERIIYDYELMYVMEGEVEMHYNNTVYQLKKSDIFYLKPNIKNFTVVDEKKHFRTHCIHFDWMPPLPNDNFTAEEFYMHSVFSKNHHEKEELLQLRYHCEPADFCIPTHICDASHERFSALFAKCYYAFLSKSPISQLRLQAAFLELIANLAELYHKSNSASFVHPKILYAIEYIKSNYTKELTAPQLAEKYKMSPKYFGTLFKAASGKSVSEFILELRLYAAKEMLIGTNMTIEEISEKIGFHNPFYFSKCFKDKETISPSKYRDIMKT